MIKSFLVVLAVALSAPDAARGFDVNRAPFQPVGEAATTCGEFIAQPGNMQIMRMEWVLGYISGRNREATSPSERLIGSSVQQSDTIIAWLRNYCQTHSLDMLISAADHLRTDLQRHE